MKNLSVDLTFHYFNCSKQVWFKAVFLKWKLSKVRWNSPNMFWKWNVLKFHSFAISFAAADINLRMFEEDQISDSSLTLAANLSLDMSRSLTDRCCKMAELAVSSDDLCSDRLSRKRTWTAFSSDAAQYNSPKVSMLCIFLIFVKKLVFEALLSNLFTTSHEHALYSFIHSGHFYSAPSSPLLLRGAPDYSKL